MKTKCIVLGEKPDKFKKTSIKFVKVINTIINSPADVILTPKIKPCEWLNIELVSNHNKISDKYDVIFAYDEDRDNGALYLGYWNDGIV